VIATTRNRERFSMLEKLGAERCEIEHRDLSTHIADAKKIDAILELVGNSVLDSLAMLRRGWPFLSCRLARRSRSDPRL
jgi:NADPH:quinone reductase